MLKPLVKLGLGLKTALGLGPKGRTSPFEKDRRLFEADVKQQLVKLKEKGINLPIFTL